MKDFAYKLKKKLGDSWGLTLLVSSIVLYVLLNIFAGGASVMAEVFTGDATAPIQVLFAVLAGVLPLLGGICSLGVLAGIIMLIMERVELAEKSRLLRAQAQARQNNTPAAGEPQSDIQETTRITVQEPAPRLDVQEPAPRRPIRNNIGLSLMIGSVVAGILSALLVVGAIFTAAIVGNDVGTNSAGAIALMGIIIVGVIVMIFSTFVFPAGMVVFIVEEVRKRKRIQAEIDSYGPAIDAPEYYYPPVDVQQDPQDDIKR